MTPGVLNSLRARLIGWLLLRSSLLLLAAVDGLLLAAVLCDAALDISEPARLALPWLLGLTALAVVAAGFFQFRALDDRKLARRLERKQPQLGTLLTNAVELACGESGGAIREVLRSEAVALGRNAALQVKTTPLVRRGILATLAALVLVLLGWVGLVLLAPDVLRAVLPRLIDVRGDHPPFSRIVLTVSPERASVLYGDSLEVRAGVRGAPVDKLWVVVRNAGRETRSAMFLAPDRSFFQTLVNLREPVEFYVTDGHARSRRFPIGIRYTPQITLAEMTTVFPEYTGRASKTSKLAEEVESFPEETRVTFRIASNRPLRDGELTLTPLLGGAARRVPLTSGAANQKTVVSGGFTLTEAISFQITVRDVDGLVCSQPRQGRLKVLPDEKPRLFVIEPGRDAVATPTIRVPVRVQAQDDYGITRIVWLRGHNHSVERPFSMPIELKSGARSVEAVGAFDLASLGVRPGDEIEYYFEAADNYPKGPNLTLSRLFKLQIISKEQYEQVLRRMAARKALFEPYFQLGGWLRRLAERGRKLDEVAQHGTEAEKKALAKEAAELAEDLQRYRSELAKVSAQARMFDIEEAFQAELARQDQALAGQSERIKQALAGGGLTAKDLKALASSLTELAGEETEEVSDPAQNIAAVAQLIARADVFVRLAREESTVAQMLRRFAEQTNTLSHAEQMEVQEMTHQQRRIHEELGKLTETLPGLLAQVPTDERFAPLRTDVEGFLKAVQEARISEDLESSARSLSELDAMTGQALAQRAAEKMDRLVSKCRGLPERGKQCLRFKPKLQASLGNSLQQILDAMGTGKGDGQGGQDGYSMFNNDVALYGPNAELTGQQGGGRRESGGSPASLAARVTGDVPDSRFDSQAAPGRVRLQPDARFPLRYREIVGEYFKVIAESDAVEGAKK